MCNNLLEISIPLDEDGFLELECDFCKNRFMLHNDLYKNGNNINLFCPICGLANKVNTFWTPEVLEKVRQVAINYIFNQLNQKVKQINKNGLIQMSVDRSNKVTQKELYRPNLVYTTLLKECCNVDVKVINVDKETGTYCPICGGWNND